MKELLNNIVEAPARAAAILFVVTYVVTWAVMSGLRIWALAPFTK